MVGCTRAGALEARRASGGSGTATVVDLRADRGGRLRSWLRGLATSRGGDEVLSPLGQAVKPRHLNAERPDNLDDLQAYALARCRQSDLAERLAAARLPPGAVAERLRARSGGKCLYSVRVHAEQPRGALPVRNTPRPAQPVTYNHLQQPSKQR